MQLQNLPEEILIIIIRKLDLWSLKNLYSTCKWIRYVICLQGVLKKCYMSRNVMATANTLKLDFFKDISYHLVELNMCGIPDLCKTVYLPAFKKLKSLRVLDVSYTNINITDLIDVYKICPTLKDITINLVCGKSPLVVGNILSECQSTFEHFENVNFIGSLFNLLSTKVALYLLAKSKLQHLRYTIVDSRLVYPVNQGFEDISNFPVFDQFTIYLLNWNNKKTFPEIHMSMAQFNVLSMLELKNYEYIIILMEEFDPKVYASPLFDNFFKDNFNVTIECIPQSDMKLFGNMVFMVWNKVTTRFDEIFYHKLIEQVKKYLPFYFLLHSELHELPAPKKYDWFYTIPVPYACGKHENALSAFKKKRVAPHNFILNYDVIFKDKEKVELSLDFKYPSNNAIALTAGCEYLRKLTYFSLVGFGRYSSDFFNILFRCCVNLVTLNVQGLPVSPCASTISRSLPLSQSLKNLRVVDKRIDFKSLFASFSQCPTLENIHIVDKSVSENNDLADPNLLIQVCDQLYSVFIEAQMTETTKRKTLQMFNKAKSRCNRPYINVKVVILEESEQCIYDPFVDVFKLNPIRPV